MNAARGFALAETDLQSFDRSFAARCFVQKPDRYRLLEKLPPDVPCIARGSGVSYCGASFDSDTLVQDMSSFNRLLDFDEQQGLLTVEAGACIGDVARFALSRGWMLPVVPGHPRATVGGCIAADVHGKNPARDGRFHDHVESLEVLTEDRTWIAASRYQNDDHFDACFAGFGIPGLISSATLRLVPAPDAYTIRRVPVANLLEAAEALLAHANAPVLYGWHDARPGHFGRGVIRFGLEAQMTKKAMPNLDDLPVAISPWPVMTWNRAGIAAMNTWISSQWCTPGSDLLSVQAAMFPLNGARRYYAGFGKEGMLEAQWLIPHANYAAFVAELCELVKRLNPRITLIASKLFDGEAPGLAFDGKGISLAIQMAQPKHARQTEFVDALTELALTHRGRPNLIKQSTLSAQTVRRAIANFEGAKAELRRFDPKSLQRSELTRRLEL